MGPELHVGCRGFPVARARYFAELSAVELSQTRARLPRVETARRWREEAPPGFVFALVAPAAVTHPGEGSPRAAEACGHFRASPVVRRAWEAFEAVSEALLPRFVVFETPVSFYPHPGMLKDMYAFLRGVRRAGRSFVWAPHARGWEPRLLAKVAADLGLILASDPLHGPLPSGGVRYLRCAGRVSANRLQREVSFSDSELRRLVEAASGALTWAFLGNRDSWRDARRLRELSLRCAA